MSARSRGRPDLPRTSLLPGRRSGLTSQTRGEAGIAGWTTKGNAGRLATFTVGVPLMDTVGVPLMPTVEPGASCAPTVHGPACCACTVGVLTTLTSCAGFSPCALDGARPPIAETRRESATTAITSLFSISMGIFLQRSHGDERTGALFQRRRTDVTTSVGRAGRPREAAYEPGGFK